MNQNPIGIQQVQGKVTIKPGRSERVRVMGAYFSILSNTATVDVIVSADGTGSNSPCKAGIGMPTVRLSDDGTTTVPAVFQYLEFRNPSDIEVMEVEYLISLGKADDTRTVVRGYLQMDLSAPKISTPAPLDVPVETFAVLPSNQLIKERIVTNTGEGRVWFGDDTISPVAGRGTPINPGGTAVINCWGAIHFKAEVGGGRISVNNILKVA